jgi:hypothetical protein
MKVTSAAGTEVLPFVRLIALIVPSMKLWMKLLRPERISTIVKVA